MAIKLSLSTLSFRYTSEVRCSYRMNSTMYVNVVVAIIFRILFSWWAQHTKERDMLLRLSVKKFQTAFEKGVFKFFLMQIASAVLIIS